MLKGNLVVGKNLSVVVHADSLHDLIKLAETKSQVSPDTGSLTLRVDLTQCTPSRDNSFDNDESLQTLLQS